jgi:hypothetical protein
MTVAVVYSISGSAGVVARVRLNASRELTARRRYEVIRGALERGSITAGEARGLRAEVRRWRLTR